MTVGLQVRKVAQDAPGGKVLLEPTSFDVAPGSILAIAGPNGAGKTTLLHLMCGVSDLTAGDILIDGQSLRQMPARTRARLIAVVGQQDMPDGRLTLRDYVTLGQIPIQADRSVAEHSRALDETLAITGLGALADKRMNVLSGGERQRAHIARALAQKPAVLFLDEPTNHLDPDAKGRMLSLVTGFGITVVMVLHDLVLIPEFASHVALMKDARLTRFGPTHEVLTSTHVRDTFGVDYLRFRHNNRVIPALDIRKTQTTPVNKDILQ